MYDSCANACTQQTCDDRVQACANGPCYAGCKCPASKPFLHYGRCVTEASCPSEYFTMALRECIFNKIIYSLFILIIIIILIFVNIYFKYLF